MTRAALWDMDGTLVDSADYHWRAWRDTVAGHGVVITRAQFQATFGQRNDAIIPQWLPGATPQDVERIGRDKETLYRRLVREGGLAPLPGAAELVRRLHEDGWLQAIASSGPRENLETVLEVTALAPHFQAVVSAEDVRHGKPDPEVFLIAAARLGVPAERSIVLEDAAFGVQAARRAGMRSLGVSPTGASLGADLEVRSLQAVNPDALAHLLAVR